MACRQGTLTPPDNILTPSHLGRACSAVETNSFPELVVFFFRTVHFEYPSVFFRFCFNIDFNIDEGYFPVYNTS